MQLCGGACEAAPHPPILTQVTGIVQEHRRSSLCRSRRPSPPAPMSRLGDVHPRPAPGAKSLNAMVDLARKRIAPYRRRSTVSLWADKRSAYAAARVTTSASRLCSVGRTSVELVGSPIDTAIRFARTRRVAYACGCTDRRLRGILCSRVRWRGLATPIDAQRTNKRPDGDATDKPRLKRVGHRKNSIEPRCRFHFASRSLPVSRRTSCKIGAIPVDNFQGSSPRFSANGSVSHRTANFPNRRICRVRYGLKCLASLSVNG